MLKTHCKCLVGIKITVKKSHLTTYGHAFGGFYFGGIKIKSPIKTSTKYPAIQCTNISYIIYTHNYNNVYQLYTYNSGRAHPYLTFHLMKGHLLHLCTCTRTGATYSDGTICFVM